MAVTQTLYRMPKLNLFIVFLISLASLSYGYIKMTDPQGNLKLDTSLEAFFSDGDGAYDYFKAVEAEFGNENLLFLVLEPARFDLEFFLFLEEIQAQLAEKVPNFDESISILNLPQRTGSCAGKSHFHRASVGGTCESALSAYQRRLACLQVAPDVNIEAVGTDEGLLDSLEQAPGESEILDERTGCPAEISQLSAEHLILQTEIQIQASLDSLARDEMLQGELLGREGQTTAVLIKLNSLDPAKRAASLQALDSLQQGWQSEKLKLYLGGQSREEYESSRTILGNLQRLAPISMALLLVVIFLLYRSWAAVLGFLVVVLSGFSLVAGALAFFGTRPNVVTLVLPPLVITIGTSYVIHFFGQYFHSARHPELDRLALMDRAFIRVVAPLSLAVGTTAIGFLALMTSPIPAVRDMGLHAALGTVIQGVLTLFALPSLLLLFPRPAVLSQNPRFWDIFFSRLAEWIVTHSKMIMICWGVLAVFALGWASQVTVDAKTSGLAPKSGVMVDKAFIESRFGGTSYLRMVFVGMSPEQPLETAEHIQGMVRLKTWLEDWNQKHPQEAVHIERLYSPVEYISAQRQGLSGLQNAEVAFYLKQLSEQHGIRYLSEDQKQLALTLRLKQDSTEAFLDFRDDLAEVLSSEFPGLEVRFTGVPILVAQSAAKISESQLLSLGTAILVIAGLLSLMFFSLKVGFLILLPNLASVLIFFGVLGMLSIPIGVTLSLVAAISLGIGLDDSIHFILHFDRNVEELKSEKLAMQKTLRSVGKPMVFTTIALVTGFGALTASDLEGQVTFGAMTAFTLSTALMSSLLLLPSLLARTRFVTLWDYLAVRYEQEFIASISIFREMTPHEFKLLTLMAERLDLPQGELLFSENQSGDVFYVLLEGQVEVFLDARMHSAEKHIAFMQSGAVFGEQILFPQAKRMDSARAVEPCKLLALDVKKITDLKDRYPLLAIKLYINLAKNLSHSLQVCYLEQTKGQVGAYSRTMATELQKFTVTLGKACNPTEKRQSVRQRPSWQKVKGWINEKRNPSIERTQEQHRRRLMALVERILETGEITYYQVVLINEYLPFAEPLSDLDAALVERLLTGIKEDCICEARPAFSNVFHRLSAAQWLWLRDHHEFINIPAGTELFHQGEAGEAMVLLLTGRIETLLVEGTETTRLNSYSAGDVFAEQGFLQNQPLRPYGAVAVEDSEVMYLSTSAFHKLTTANKKLAAELAYNLVGVMATKLRRCILKVCA